MSESFKPREHDHLVEPMYHALQEREGELPEPALHAEPRRRDQVRLWVLPLLVTGIWLILRYVSG